MADSPEVKQRLGALAEKGKTARAAGRFDDAIAAYEEMGRVAAAELGPTSDDALLARYFTGLALDDRGDHAAAARAFAEALAGFESGRTPEGTGRNESNPEKARERAVIGAALGLSLLRAQE